MNTTHKAYRDGLAEDLYSERKSTQEKIRRIKVNPDFPDSSKEEAIKKAQEELYSKLDYVRSTPEYKAAKAMKQELVAKKKDVKKQEEILAEQKKLLVDKEAELATMSEEYGEKSEKKAETKESKEITKEHLLNKPNMTSTDKENMQKSITYLEEKGMDIQKNLKKLDAINYGSNYIEIGGVKFSREKLVPQVKFNKKPNEYDVFESDKKGVFKAMYNGKEEYYLTTDAYIEESKKQGKKAITDDHIRKALQALPGEYSNNKRYEGANILGNILNLSMSGCVDSDGGFGFKGQYGYLCSASPVSTIFTRAFGFGEDKGLLDYGYYRDAARPCLFVVE